MECKICGRRPIQDNAILYRINEKGADGIWHCENHYTGEVDTVIDDIVKVIQIKHEAAQKAGLSIQTIAMIEAAGDNIIVYAGQHNLTKKYHGCLSVNHPAPSGWPRWMTIASDSRGFDTSEEALAAFTETLTQAGIKYEKKSS